MLLTALALTFVVFCLTNITPNLGKLATRQGNLRMTDAQVATWLGNRAYLDPNVTRYGQWLGVLCAAT
ncbi:hypothetical protein [Puniceibacterium antarcticum]|uniref:hypothetical protein n=1 Tax=Puniceibacterium antarcticum TaxID=1206336 RepID=UPI000C198402|nr:hypothetical protein [Puniceibacterium antarcticum]